MAKVLVGNEFETEVIKKEGVTLVDFFAVWCGPCKMIAPVLEELSTEMAGKANIVKVDIDQQSHLADEYRISSVPTMVIFKDGKEVERIVGFQPKQSLIAKLEKYSS
ncbi:MAG: thioredoxin [Clostridiaceae bacterium]